MCPRGCNVDRSNSSGFCGPNKIKIAHAMIHKWEEPVISGDGTKGGSGAIFFSGCNLKCVYCQNKDISRGAVGKDFTPENLVNLIKELETDGAYNINFVTPTHFTDEIITALKLYKPKVPVVWNTSGYEKPETIEKLKGFVDIFLTDLKYVNEEISLKYSKAKDYFYYASRAIKKMREQVPKDIIENGLMKKGLIIRHLVLPSNTSDSIAVLNWINDNLGNKTIVSIMSQFTLNGEEEQYPELNKHLTKIEYTRVVKKAVSLGFKNAYIQEHSSSSADYIPEFLKENKYI